MTPLLLKALRCENFNSRPPVWLMRQAGRYMPQYRALREQYTFLEMCRTPEIAAEVTQLPIDAFGMDAAILFSDILVTVAALGLDLHFDDGIGPVIDNPIATTEQVYHLPTPNVEEKLGYVRDAIRLLKQTLSVPLIGFCGAPFTVASYMIEGGTSKKFKKTKQWMLNNSEAFHQLLQHLAICTADYINMQIAAGADAIQIFDSWAHILTHYHFHEFSLHYIEELMARIDNPDIPIILFCRGSSLFAQDLAEAAPSAISLDWGGDLAAIRRALPGNIALQGNLDPDILYAAPQTVKSETLRILDKMSGDPGYIFNLGHGILPDTPVVSVTTLVETIKSYVPTTSCDPRSRH